MSLTKKAVVNNGCALLLAVIVLFSTGCKKWLNVQPKTQISEEEQFSTKQGYIDALFGLYQQMASANAYGVLGTYGFIDVLAQSFEGKSSTSNFYGQAARYNYTFTSTSTSQLGVKTSIATLWSNYYKIIAQSNFLLKNIDANNVLKGQDHDIIRGEALAVRALLHFDLLRMFGPAYLNGQNAGDSTIPYMKEFTINPHAKLSMGEVLDLCEADLKEAEILLSVLPDINQIANMQGVTNVDLDYLMFRQNHLNYWAVKALLARLYIYKGDKANAYKYANDVINSNFFSFITPSRIDITTTANTSDMTFSSEHVFSLYVSDQKTNVDLYFKNTGNAAAADANDLYSTNANLVAMYESAAVGYGTDVRGPSASKSLWNTLTANIVYNKKYFSDAPANVKQFLLPVIRLSEMYYIAAESAPTISDGLKYLNTVRVARLIPALAESAINTDQLLNAEIQKEYRKEFYAEGQLWFYYKRKNVLTIPAAGTVGGTMTPAKYRFPLPDAEIQYGLN